MLHRGKGYGWMRKSALMIPLIDQAGKLVKNGIIDIPFQYPPKGKTDLTITLLTRKIHKTGLIPSGSGYS
jgi:hypothetical protein